MIIIGLPHRYRLTKKVSVDGLQISRRMWLALQQRWVAIAGLALMPLTNLRHRLSELAQQPFMRVVKTGAITFQKNLVLAAAGRQSFSICCKTGYVLQLPDVQ